MKTNTIENIDCLEGLRKLPDGCVDCCVTSPPYYGLRDYGVNGQIGLEGTPEAFVAKMVEVFSEVRRVLKKEGTLWLNLGDSYAAAGKNRTVEQAARNSNLTGKGNQIACKDQPNKITGDLKAKDLIGIPWMVAFALRSTRWYLRQDIIWHKPNPMPEPVTDRCTKSHEYIFLFSKSQKYYFDQKAILQPIVEASISRTNQNTEGQEGSNRVPGKGNGPMKAVVRKSCNRERKPGSERGCPENNSVSNLCGSVPWEGSMANKRSVWTVTTKPFSEAHFATFPEELIVDCIKAGCPANGLVLDPFMGAGTTALVSAKLGRNYVGFELNPQYIKIANTRLKKELGFFHPDQIDKREAV